MSFGGDVGKWADKAEARLDLAFRKIALESFSRVILRSPVDTGRFRGNWDVSIGSLPDGFEIEEDYVDPTGLRVIKAVEDAVITLNFGETIWLINNLPYARRLEYGWSQQAPGGMVRITAMEFQPIVEKIAKELNR